MHFQDYDYGVSGEDFEILDDNAPGRTVEELLDY